MPPSKVRVQEQVDTIDVRQGNESNQHKKSQCNTERTRKDRCSSHATATRSCGGGSKKRNTATATKQKITTQQYRNLTPKRVFWVVVMGVLDNLVSMSCLITKYKVTRLLDLQKCTESRTSAHPAVVLIQELRTTPSIQEPTQQKSCPANSNKNSSSSLSTKATHVTKRGAFRSI